MNYLSVRLLTQTVPGCRRNSIRQAFGLTGGCAIGDDRSDILKALEEETIKADIILITGGLGPTADDITKPVTLRIFQYHPDH